MVAVLRAGHFYGQVKLIKMGERIVRHARQIVFQLAEVEVSRELFAAILERISRLSLAPG